MDPREWFNESTYSDLTIVLSNGAEIKVHKVIVCRLNEYFCKLCGPDSHFAESKQPTVVLKDDDPVALTNVLRTIYNLPLTKDSSSKSTWRFWLNLRTTADKYLVPKLRDQANQEFRNVALATTNADEVFDIIEAIESEMPYDQPLTKLAETIRTNNFGRLLQNKRFRAKLDSGGKQALWQVIDVLAFAAPLKEKRYFLCDEHRAQVFQEPSKDKSSMEHCTSCQGKSGSYYASSMPRTGRAAWIDM